MKPQKDLPFSSRIFKFWRDGNVKRYHTVATDTFQKTSAHSWGVAAICMMLYPKCSAELLKWCIIHDVPEAWTGDVPAHVKWESPELAKLLASLENSYLISMGYPVPEKLSEVEKLQLKVCDLLELVFFAYKEYALEAKMEFLLVLRRGILYIENNYLDSLERLGQDNTQLREILDTMKLQPFVGSEGQVCLGNERISADT